MSGPVAVQTQTAARPTITLSTSGLLQRQCACGQHTSAGGECEECKKKREGKLQRAAINSASTTEVPPIVHDVLRSPGQPLDATTRSFMEPRFGHDFSGIHPRHAATTQTMPLKLGEPTDHAEQEADGIAERVVNTPQLERTNQQTDFSMVRVHTDRRAAESARAVNALAYTVGQAVVFGAGQYAPGTRAGQRLLAHELAHTLQQANGLRPAVQRKLQVGAGLALDTKGFTTTKTGDVYTCPAAVKNSTWNEIFTSLLFSPRVFKLDGKTNTEIDTNLDKHMTARHGIVEFATKKQYTFGAGSAFKMNPAYWIVDATGWRPKPGVDRDKAIQDLNVHPKEYSIACLAATQLTMEGGGKSPLADDTGVALTDWIPGDWGYITNTKFPSGGTAGLEGENIIYTGKDKFWGHFGPGNTYKTFQEWFDEVKGWHGGANAEDYRTRPTIGLI
jgi:hypothetical protein